MSRPAHDVPERRPRLIVLDSLMVGLAAAAAYFALCEIGYAFYFPEHRVAAFWPATGAFMAALAIARAARWPAVLLGLVAGAVLNASFHDEPPITGGLYAASNLASVATGGWLLRRGFARRAGSRARLLAVLTAGFGATTLSASIGAAASTLTYDQQSYWYTWQVWWRADVLGTLLVAPPLLALVHPPVVRPAASGARANLALAVAVVLVAIGAFFVLPIDSAARVHVPYLVLPLLLVLALRCRPLTLAATLLAVALIALQATAAGRGPYPLEGVTLRSNILTLQVFLILCTTAAWALYSFNQERLTLEEQLRESAKLEAIGRLAGGIAHDFNNLLTPILLGCSTIARRTRDPRVEEETASIAQCARRAAEITGQLLTFARRDRNEPAVVDMREIVRQVDGMLDRLLDAAIERDTQLSNEVCPVRANTAQLVQVVLNLALNARDAMPAGGRLSMHLTREGDEIVLRVADTGEGMDEATRARIFEPFFTTKADAQGTGLGLAVARSVVTEAGGRIQCTTVPGQGTTLEARLPRANKHEMTVAPALPALVTGGGALLLIEDDAMVARAIGASLAEAGFEVETIDRADAVEAVEAPQRFAVIVSDVDLPGGGGPRAVEQLRKRGATAAAIVFVSGYAPGDKIPTTIDFPFAFVQKPFAPEQLIEAIEDQRARRDDTSATGGARAEIGEAPVP